MIAEGIFLHSVVVFGKHMIAVKVWNELRAVSASDLYEAFGDADLSGVTDNLLVLKSGERAVDFWVPAGFVNRHVLIHDGNVNLIAECFMNPV